MTANTATRGDDYGTEMGHEYARFVWVDGVELDEDECGD